jgi:hypothetical protein
VASGFAVFAADFLICHSLCSSDLLQNGAKCAALVADDEDLTITQTNPDGGFANRWKTPTVNLGDANQFPDCIVAADENDTLGYLERHFPPSKQTTNCSKNIHDAAVHGLTVVTAPGSDSQNEIGIATFC